MTANLASFSEELESLPRQIDNPTTDTDTVRQKFLGVLAFLLVMTRRQGPEVIDHGALGALGEGPNGRDVYEQHSADGHVVRMSFETFASHDDAPELKFKVTPSTNAPGVGAPGSPDPSAN